ncbi:hypothetical protein BGZ83_010369 [Gryganskiella cystojenkinii]|nr:hypothetical protein BGZ83_010369 [Gryganskiella cystojenkinii]
MMMSFPSLGRFLVLFICCAIFLQLVLFFNSHSPSDLNVYDSQNVQEDETSSSFSTENNDLQQSNNKYYGGDPGRNRHPTVPLSLKDLQQLDELADKIAKVEADRVFENKEIGRIHGTKINNDRILVQKVRDQIQCWTHHGSWQRQDTETHKTLKHLGDSRFAKCDKNFMKALDREGNGHFLGEYDHVHERLLVREAAKWKWVPDETICGPQGQMGLANNRAVFKDFTKPEFCAVMERRDILVVGDLTQYQIHDVLLSAFESSFVCYGELGCLHHSAHGLCGGVALKYARNDLLSVPWAVDPEEEEFPSASTVEQAWATPEMLLKYKVLILNRGLFWRPDEIFMSEMIFTMKHLWKYYPDLLIIYRASHPVTSDCTNLKSHGEDEAILDKATGRTVVEGTVLQKPLMEPPMRSSSSSSSSSSSGKTEFRPTVADIQRQNRIAKEIVEAAGGIYLDTESMFAMRPDGRMGEGDCARFCAPGPLDAYANLIYNTLRILQDQYYNDYPIVLMVDIDKVRQSQYSIHIVYLVRKTPSLQRETVQEYTRSQ